MGGRGAKRLKVAQDGTAKETAPAANSPPADVRERKFTDVRTNAKPNALYDYSFPPRTHTPFPHSFFVTQLHDVLPREPGGHGPHERG